MYTNSNLTVSLKNNDGVIQFYCGDINVGFFDFNTGRIVKADICQEDLKRIEDSGCVRMSSYANGELFII